MKKINQKSEAAKIFADVEYVLAHAIAVPAQLLFWGLNDPDGIADLTYVISIGAADFERDTDAPIIVEIFDDWVEVSISTSETTLTRTKVVPNILEAYLEQLEWLNSTEKIEENCLTVFKKVRSKTNCVTWEEVKVLPIRGSIQNLSSNIYTVKKLFNTVEQLKGLGSYHLVITTKEDVLVDEVFVETNSTNITFLDPYRDLAVTI